MNNRNHPGRRAVVVLFMMVLLLPGSALGAPPTMKLRLALPAPPGLAQIPLLLAGERLQARGIELELMTLAQPPLVLQALLRGSADVGAVSLPLSSAAIQQGADLKFFLTQLRNDWTLYGRKGLGSCADLTGRSIAVHSSTGLSAALVRTWLVERCPGTKTQLLIIPGSENRAAALMARQIDLTALELADAIEVDRLRPGEFHRVADFGRDLPWLLSVMYIATADRLAGRREVLKTFTREVLAMHQIAARDPELIAVAAAKYIRAYEPGSMTVLARAYADSGLWPVDGAFTPRAFGRTLDFLEQSGSIKPGLRIERIADFTLVQEVLREMGR